jgi:DNA-binding transcriptional ArsR family regulator
MNISDMQANAGEASALLKSLSNPSRLLMLCALLIEEHTAGELEELAGLSQSAVSQHLARLRAEGIVDGRRDGQLVIYSLADEKKVRPVIEVLHKLFCSR